MATPAPRAGLVIRYSYLWRAEQRLGREEGVKDRPCAILLCVEDNPRGARVVVLPVTHAPPSNAAHAIEIPITTKRRLGLDDARSWIVLTEANRFTWPGPDVRHVKSGEPSGFSYGELPAKLYEQVRGQWLALHAARRTELVMRTE